MTAQQRIRIRFHLDKHFDPDKGWYSEGWDDARVAKEAGVLIETVTKVREAAYGELKPRVDVEAVRQELALIWRLYEDKVMAVAAEFSAKISEIEEKLR